MKQMLKIELERAFKSAGLKVSLLPKGVGRIAAFRR